jgi:hypothetical protein
VVGWVEARGMSQLQVIEGSKLVVVGERITKPAGTSETMAAMCSPKAILGERA